MLDALQGLTTRGRAFLGAGAGAATCAILFGQRDLLRISILVLALPLLSALMVARTRYRLSCSRHLAPGRVGAGDDARVVLRLVNVSRLPTGLLLAEDRIPYVLGARPRFVMDRVEPRGARDVSYTVRCDLRGQYPIGPLTIRLTDPFGMCELLRSFQDSDTLVVTPVVEQLTHVPLGGSWSGSGESRSRSVASAGEDDIATREYRQGDDLRRVHWRTTAKYGELMVRREEQPWESRCMMLLDTRGSAHRGEGPASSFEFAVSAAASLSHYASQHGFSVDLISDLGVHLGLAREFGSGIAEGAAEGLLLDALAVVESSTAVGLSAAEPLLRRRGDGLTMAVLGAIDDLQAANLVRARRGSGTAVAVLLDVDSWRSALTRNPGTSADQGPAALVLRAAGWRVMTIAQGESLATAWPHLAATPAGEARWTLPEPVESAP